ncbi:MAG: ParB/RepB/Spo0J family partition protein [Pseudomonadales bacterium]|nr:ParB/RepB/Spo0J family partition protein [Pseudomonadales bacterium]
MTRKRGLGRGLDALLSNSTAGALTSEQTQQPSNEQAGSQQTNSPKPNATSMREIPVDQIYAGKYQPRKNIKQDSLEELAASIKVQGVMQPIVLRGIASGGYEIVAGERRWRATMLAGLDIIPAVITDVSDERAIAMALIENIQREDLNPLEEAVALRRLQEELQLTQQQVADAVGKSRVAVTNLLRLLNLSKNVREMLADGLMEMGHARALLSLESSDQAKLAQKVIAGGLSVRQTEALVRKYLVGDKPVVLSQRDPDTMRLEFQLSEKVGAPVSIVDKKGKGQLIIKYSSLQELEGILGHIA